MSPERKVTIHDVAQEAGVSISSVSRALNGHPYVSEQLRTQVEAAAHHLGYRPDPLAQSLRKGSTRSVGFLIGTISNPVMANIFASAADVLAAHGYATLMACSQNNPQLDVAYLRFLAERQVDGLIISSASGGPDQASPLVTKLGIPAVMLDRALPPGEHVSAVQSDHTGGMRAAVNHLVTRGHHRIAMIGGPEYFYLARERLLAFQTALREAGILAEPELVRSVRMHESAGYIETLALFGHKQPPTALIAAGNVILIGVLRALRDRGVIIGRDLALIGSDDFDLARLYTPSITVIARDLTLVGETAAHLLLETIEKQGRRIITIPTELIIRESTSS